MPEQESPGGQPVSFGNFTLSLAKRMLSRDGQPVELGGRAFDILVALVERAGKVVGKAELIDVVWPDTVVEEGSLRVHVASLRKVLGDGQSGAKYVTTVYGGGYCFVAPVVRSEAQSNASPASGTIQHRLPAFQSRMIGRDEQLTDLVAQVKAERLVTIVGPGGIGKTTLAVEAGRALLDVFAGEVVFLDLAPVGDPQFTPGAVAAALGLVQTDDPIAGVIARLKDRRTLLILDSCEHVIDQVAELAERFLQGSPQTHILATSREALRAHGEQVRMLPPLACPPSAANLDAPQVMGFAAAQLLVERVAAGGNPLALGDMEPAWVAEICRALDGIPLAIELAAGSINAFGLRETAHRLNSRIELLWEGRRTAPARHQTLGAMLDWSYHLLTAIERTVLCRLSTFAGQFSLEAAKVVAVGPDAGEDEIVLALTGLVAKSLVAVDASQAIATYRLLDTTRIYVSGKLNESGEAQLAAFRHAAYFLRLLEETGAAPPSTADGKVFSNFGIHVGNIRAALEWAFREPEGRPLAVPLAAASAHLFMEMSLLAECRRWTDQALAMLDETTRDTRPEMELQAASGFSRMHIEGCTERVEQALRRSLMLAEKLGHLHYQLRLLSRLHLFYSRVGQFRSALECARRCEPVAAEIGDPLAVAEAHTAMGASRLFEGNCVAARRHFDAALVELHVSSQIDVFHFGAFDFRARVRVALALALWLQGFPDIAMATARDSVETERPLNHPVTVCTILVLAARVFLWDRQLDEAERCAHRLLATADRHFLQPYRAAAHAFHGELLVSRGEPEAGVARLRAALSSLHAHRYEIQTTSFMIAVAEGLAMMHQHQAALAAAEEAAAMIERNGDLCVLPELLRVKGSILISAGGAPADAEHCLRSALDLAVQQQARGWELRTATSLAGLCAGRGRRDEARAVLAPVYARFSEGFDHADLLTAQLLLRELG